MLTITAQITDPDVIPAALVVELKSPAHGYALRELATQRILPLPLAQLFDVEQDTFQLATDDPTPGTLYEYWLKIQAADYTFYVYSDICSVASQEPLGSVVADDDDPPPARRIRLQLKRSPLKNFGRYRGDAIRVQINVIEAVGITPFIFGHIARPINAETDERVRDFSFITSPLDEAAYPLGAPNLAQSPPAYRLRSIDVLVPNPAAARHLWHRVKVEVDNLVASYNRRDDLLHGKTETIG